MNLGVFPSELVVLECPRLLKCTAVTDLSRTVHSHRKWMGFIGTARDGCKETKGKETVFFTIRFWLVVGRRQGSVHDVK
jgi:hypothetical protein